MCNQLKVITQNQKDDYSKEDNNGVSSDILFYSNNVSVPEIPKTEI